MTGCRGSVPLARNDLTEPGAPRAYPPDLLTPNYLQVDTRRVSEPLDTFNRILDAAQELVQERGFNKMGHTDISRRLGIRNASIHYHFAKKAELGVALVYRYRRHLEAQLRNIDDVGVSPPEQLERYLAAYRAVVHPDGRICLCTVLAGDYNTLPEGMQREVRAFFDLNETWLTRVFAEGRATQTLRVPDTPEGAAFAFLATLEGTMLLARASGNVKRFETFAQRSLGVLRMA